LLQIDIDPGTDDDRDCGLGRRVIFRVITSIAFIAYLRLSLLLWADLVDAILNFYL